MNGSELPHSDDNAPQTSRSESRPLFLESIFLGPHGVRAGWRAALYVALFRIREPTQEVVVADPPGLEVQR